MDKKFMIMIGIIAFLVLALVWFAYGQNYVTNIKFEAKNEIIVRIIQQTQLGEQVRLTDGVNEAICLNPYQEGEIKNG